MHLRFPALLFLLIFSFSCLPFTIASAQSQLAQWGPPPTPEERERWREEHERERWREERREERREWREEEWQRHHQRYFGGVVIQPGPGESYESYVHRVRAQCNVQWSNCATYCNAIYDPYQRAACVSNCNNELYECQSRF